MKAAEEAVQAAALKNTGASRYTEETHKESSLEIEQPPEPKDTESNLKPDQVQQIENKGMEDSVSLPQQDKKEPMLETKDTAAGIASDGALVEKNAKPRIDAANDELPKTKHHSPISDSPLLKWATTL
ncbi:MAG UNVERIFIED_CONTAM: hypothetical protein LVQ98_01260 [Rickettsiaceae bacterium]|jgi:hypothetical protein